MGNKKIILFSSSDLIQFAGAHIFEITKDFNSREEGFAGIISCILNENKDLIGKFDDLFTSDPKTALGYEKAIGTMLKDDSCIDHKPVYINACKQQDFTRKSDFLSLIRKLGINNIDIEIIDIPSTFLSILITTEILSELKEFPKEKLAEMAVANAAKRKVPPQPASSGAVTANKPHPAPKVPGTALTPAKASAPISQNTPKDKNTDNTRININSSEFEKIFGKINTNNSGKYATELHDDRGDHLANIYKNGIGEAGLIKEAIPVYSTQKFGTINDFTFSPLRDKFYYADGKKIYDQNKELVVSFEHDVWDILYVGDILIVRLLEKLKYINQVSKEWAGGDYGCTYDVYNAVTSTVFYDLNAKKIICSVNDLPMIETIAVLDKDQGAICFLFMDDKRNIYSFDSKSKKPLLIYADKVEELHGRLYEKLRPSGRLVFYTDYAFILCTHGANKLISSTSNKTYDTLSDLLNSEH